MEAYKFDTTILDNGIINLPDLSRLAHRQIEIFVVLKDTETTRSGEKKQAIDAFLDKWTGLLGDIDPDETKLQYLMEKYK